MSMLDGFERFDIEDQPPKLIVDANGVTFNAAVAEQLGNPQKVFFLVDDKYRRVALQSLSGEDDQGIDFWSPENASRETIRWNTRKLARKLEELGSLDLQHSNYELKGFLIDDEDAMFFDLNTAKSLPKAQVSAE